MLVQVHGDSSAWPYKFGRFIPEMALVIRPCLTEPLTLCIFLVTRQGMEELEMTRGCLSCVCEVEKRGMHERFRLEALCVV